MNRAKEVIDVFHTGTARALACSVDYDVSLSRICPIASAATVARIKNTLKDLTEVVLDDKS